MKRAWVVLIVLPLAALVAVSVAQAQTSVGVQLFGIAAGGKVLSQTSIPVQVQGDLVVSFHGDPATGCVASGLCPYSGTIVVRPQTGDVAVATYRQGGRIRHLVSVALGLGQNGYTTSARVQRSVPGGPAATCADASPSPFGGETAGVIAGRLVTIRVLDTNGSLLTTRCAGPTDADLAGAAPAVTIPMARLMRGRTTLDLSGTNTFASHGFAGTLTSTLTMKLGKPQTQSGNGSPPPGVKTQPTRIVTEHLSLVGVRGQLSAAFSATGNPIVCGLLDSCGASGTLTLDNTPRLASAQVIATAPASRPYRDFLTALGLSRSGRAHGIALAMLVSWQADVSATVSQPGGTCTDTAPIGGVSLTFVTGQGSLGGFVGPWRTRCPGPALINATPFLTGAFDPSVLGRRDLTLTARATGSLSDGGYVIVPRGSLSIVLRRGTVSQQVVAQPAG
jgi:hypothetical protein